MIIFPVRFKTHKMGEGRKSWEKKINQVKILYFDKWAFDLFLELFMGQNPFKSEREEREQGEKVR